MAEALRATHGGFEAIWGGNSAAIELVGKEAGGGAWRRIVARGEGAKREVEDEVED